MARGQRSVSRGFAHSVFGLLAVAAALTAATSPADARRHRHGVRHSVHVNVQAGRHVSHHSVHENGYNPPQSSIVVDGNSGKTLQESNADSLRHPASLTKIMTLYLLFERLESGKMKLSSTMPVSEHAADQAPTKLDLKAGQNLAVEDAIRGIVTRSANDAAVVVAEAIGGDEESFAKMMTAKAHALGMAHTTYVNASGLPDDDQVTTARDQATLGRAIQDRFPRYYHYFSLPSFTFRGEEIRNHDHLLGQYGIDGIKTGYTRASGFNLVTSLHRDGRHIVAVVLGGSSARARDAHMRELIEAHLDAASTRRTAPLLAETEEPMRVATRGLHPAAPSAPPASNYSLATVSSIPVQAPNAAIQGPVMAVRHHATPPGSNEPIRPIAVKTIKVKLAPVKTASLAPPAPMITVKDEPAATAAPAPAPAAPQPPPAAHPAPTWSQQAPASWPMIAAAAQAAPAPQPAPAATAKAEPAAPPTPPPAPPPARSLQAPAHTPVHTGWIIQIGAFGSESEARQHLDAAQSKVSLLGHADSFTETVTKGEKTYYRARFAGLAKEQAEETCRKLRRSDIACITVKN